MIHPSAIIDSSALIHPNVTIGPFSIIGPEVEIGEGTIVAAHTIIRGPTKIGQNNRFFSFCSIGEDSQDLKFTGEKTFLEIGDHNVFREFCTVNRGTAGGSVTRVGNHNYFLNYVHLAHDCQVGNHVVFSNNATLAGHVIVEDYVLLGGFAAAHQFTTIGRYSFVSAKCAIFQDVIPYIIVAGERGKPAGLNKVGLQRRGFSDDLISQLGKAYRIIFRQKKTLNQALEELKEMAKNCPEILPIITLMKRSERGITR